MQLFGKSIYWFYLLPVFQLLIVVAGLFIFLDKYSIFRRLLVIFIILITPSFVESFFSLVIPERNVIFWLVIFLVGLKYFKKTEINYYGCIVLVATHFALYYKEPLFLFFGIFSAVRLIYYAGQKKEEVFDPKKIYQMFLVRNKIDVGIFLLSSIFVGLYLIINLPYRSTEYATSRSIDSETAFFYLLKSNYLLAIFIVITIVRLLFLLLRRRKINPVWDSLAIASLAYFFFYVKIGLILAYYLAPANLIAVLYMNSILLESSRHRNWLKILLLMLATIIVIQNCNISSNQIFYRLNFINSRVQIAQFLKIYAEQEKAQNIGLFFPKVTENYKIYYFSCLLKYKNLQLADVLSPEISTKTTYIMKSPLNFPEPNVCVNFDWNHHCFHSKSAQIGDLIIIFPDNYIDEKYLKELQENNKLVFHYKSHPPSHYVPYFYPLNGYVFKKEK